MAANINWTGSEEIVPGLDGLSPVHGEPCGDDRAALDALGRDATTTPFQHADWLASWRKSSEASGSTPVTVIGWRSGRAVIALPFALHRSSLGGRLTWQADRLSDYGAPIAAPDFLQGLSEDDARCLLLAAGRAVEGADVLHLVKMPCTIAGVENPFCLPETMDHHAGAHAIDMEGDTFDAFYESLRSAKTRQGLRKKMKALEKMGEVRLGMAADRAEAAAIIADGLDMKSVQLDRAGHANPFAEKATRQWILAHFADHLKSSTWAASMEVGGRRVCAAFGFRDASRFLVYQFAIADTPEARYSPGQHMLVHLMRHAFDDGARRLDLSLGDEAYKMDWCNFHSRLQTVILPLTLKGRVQAQMLSRRTSLASWFAAKPERYRIAQQLKPRLARLGIRV